MITRFDDKYEFDREFTAIVAQDVVYRGEDTVVKLYIPLLMPDITEGAAGISRIACPIDRIYANAKGTIPKISSTKITEKNYLNAKIDINSELKPISEVSTSIAIKEYSSELCLLDGEAIYDATLYETDEVTEEPDSYYDNTGNNADDTTSNNLPSTSAERVNNANDVLESTPTEEPYLRESSCVYSSGGTEDLALILEDESGNTVYDSSDIYNTNTLSLTDDENNIVFRSVYGSKGMTFREAMELYHYKIKKDSNVRCRFLNKKASKLYMNTDNI